uniref:Uncharacterized protein n=1 Tax=Anguilla anguilla TaxID=7936 RepID=A0A0E9Y1Q6_ANGAN
MHSKQYIVSIYSVGGSPVSWLNSKPGSLKLAT